MTTQLVRITQDVEIPYLTYQGQPVLTFAQIDQVHNRPEGTAGRNFRANKEHFIENEDYFQLSQAAMEAIDEFRPSLNPKGIVLIAESGYLMLVKSFTDKLAWQIQRQLVKIYFRVKAFAEQPAPKPGIPDSQWREVLNLIHAIARHCHFENKASEAVHERIRWIGGVPSSRQLAPEQLGDIKAELAALSELADQHFNQYVARDEALIESVLRPPVSIRKVRALVRRQALQPGLPV